MARDMMVTNPDGTKEWNHALIAEHSNFLDTVLRVFRTKRTALELLRTNIIKDANAVERARIAEEDKKYQPKFAEREAAERAKQTAEEKRIQYYIKNGMSRETAEKIVFKGEKPAQPGANKPSALAAKLGLTKADIDKLIMGK
jgi:hypothetical protein